jgi:hypothetical protein
VKVGRDEPVVLHGVPYTITPQREARTVSLILEPPARALAAIPGLGIRKDLRIADEALSVGVRYRLRNDGEEDIALTFTSALNLALLSETGTNDTITLGTRKTTPGKPLEHRNVTEIQVHSETRHFDITLAVEPGAQVAVKPIYAVANSEQGFERLYEQTEIACSWDVTIEPGLHVDLEIRTSAVGQMVEPEITRPTRRARKVVAPAGTATPTPEPARRR